MDSLDGGNGDDNYTVTLGDRLIDSAGIDTVVATTTYFLQTGVAIENLVAEKNGAQSLDIALYGNNFAQTITGNNADNFIHGGAGADTIAGGAGYDTASYLLSLAGVEVDLNQLTQTGGAAEGDELTGIEALQGSLFDDVLIGIATETGATSYDDEHFGLTGDDWIEDTLGVNTLHGGEGDDTLVGSGTLPAIWGRGSLLSGGIGNDSLSGGVTSLNGGDTLVGGMGDDTYHVTSNGDVVDENFLAEIGPGVDGGKDLLISDVTTWTMDTVNQADIEDALLGLGVNLTANALNNLVTGNARDNSLTALAGNDTIEALDGADTLLGGDGNDLLRSGDGDDTASGGDGDDTIYGSFGSDTLNGGIGNDLLDGGAGADILTGALGDDTFLVDNTSDIATDNLNSGHDQVRSSVTFTLSSNIEDMLLTGTNMIDGTGNVLANYLRGNDAANRLTGVSGLDTLEGGGGGDIYIVDGDDTIIEANLGGRDAVLSSGTVTLAAFVEDLTLTGLSAINGTGNGMNNAILGNAAANYLNGLGGADTMTGGTGTDIFVFTSTLGPANADTITDFSVPNDTFWLDVSVFTGLALGTLASAAFKSNLTGLAENAFQHIIYDKGTGSLYFDEDGDGVIAHKLFATLSPNLLLTFADFEGI